MALTDPSNAKHPIAGTFTANPLSLTACNAMLREIENDTTLYQRLDRTTEYLATQIEELLAENRIDTVINRVASMFQIYFTKNNQVRNYRDTLTIDNKLYNQFLLSMINNGIFPNPKPLGRWYLSAAHTEKEIEETIRAVEETVKQLK